MEQQLTEEQRERIRKNRERALELRKRKLEEEDAKRKKKKDDDGVVVQIMEEQPITKRAKESIDKKVEETIELEDFEVGASEFVTKTEAMKMYCLPEGTLAVCQFIEKQNPKHKGWNPMKLYYRNEIRKRARERHGGIEGLIRERKERAQKRFKKDLEKTKDIFR